MREPLVYPQVFAPKAQWNVAGGGAKRNHRKRAEYVTRPGRGAGSGVPPGRKFSSDLSRWLRFAPPPANFERPFGTQGISNDLCTN